MSNPGYAGAGVRRGCDACWRPFVFPGVIVVFILVVILNSVRVLREYERGVIFRLGRFVGHRPQWKKAIVRLAEGQAIEFFEGV